MIATQKTQRILETLYCTTRLTTAQRDYQKRLQKVFCLRVQDVQIAKKGLEKILISEPPNPVMQTISFFLFNYRNTPSTVTKKSPNEMLFSIALAQC